MLWTVETEHAEVLKKAIQDIYRNGRTRRR